MAITTITRSQSDILRDSRQNLTQNVGITADNPTSTSLNLLQSMAQEVSSLWNYMNGVLSNGFLSTAYGAALDEFGVLLQEPRQGSLRAMDLSSTNVKFYMDETYASNITDLLTRYFTVSDRTSLFAAGIIDSVTNPSLINIMANLTISSADGSASYTTMNAMVISNANDFDFTPVIANGIGSRYNVSPGVLTVSTLTSVTPIFSKITNAIKVTNLYGIRNGNDSESDDNYRFRLSNKVVSAVTGNEASIRKAVISVPDVVDMSLVPRTHGNGTFTIFPQTIDPILSDGVMLAVQTSVNSVMSIGSVCYVEAPSYLAVAFNIQLRFLPGADTGTIFTNARLAVMNYINNLSLGGQIIINEIIQIVMSLDTHIMDMSIPGFGFGNYDRSTGVISNYMPLRIMNQQADWNQKWYTNSNLCALCQAGTN